MKRYSEDEQRVVDYLCDLTPDIGAGEDPIGFLMASHAMLVHERKWKAFEDAPTDGTEVLFWVSSQKGFQDTVAPFYYVTKEMADLCSFVYSDEGWHWSETEEPLKRPDLVRGWKEYPQAPKQFSTEDDKVKAT